MVCQYLDTYRKDPRVVPHVFRIVESTVTLVCLPFPREPGENTSYYSSGNPEYERSNRWTSVILWRLQVGMTKQGVIGIRREILDLDSWKGLSRLTVTFLDETPPHTSLFRGHPPTSFCTKIVVSGPNSCTGEKVTNRPQPSVTEYSRLTRVEKVQSRASRVSPSNFNQ